MNSFKISFLTLLRSTAMTLLFIPGVSAMYDDLEVLQSSSEGRASTSGAGTSSSIEFEQTKEEKTATEIRNQLNLGEPNKIFSSEEGPYRGCYFIKGEVPGDGSCFLHTLDLLFPGRGISRDEFATRLRTAFFIGKFIGENSTVSEQEIREEFAAELYTQLYQQKVHGTALKFKVEGEEKEEKLKEINELSRNLLNNAPPDYLKFRENAGKIIESIYTNDKIIEEMLFCFAQTQTKLSLPAADLGNIGSFGLACKLFGLNLDIYSPIPDKPNSLYKRREEFRFGGASLPQAALYASAHVSPLCLEDDFRTRRRFARNDLDLAIRTYEKNASQSDPLSFLKEIGSNPLDVRYLSNRLKVGNALQYAMNMPQAPVIHPYNIGIDYPLFPYAARLSPGELDPNLFPALSEAQATLLSLGIDDPEAADYFYVVQNASWIETRSRFLQPQSWAFPDAPYSSESPYWKSAKINVTISSPNNAITLASLSEGDIISHNFVTLENPNGNQLVVSSGPTFPILAGFKEDQTSFFVSTVVIPDTKRAAVTFHTILDDSDFDQLQRAKINTLPDLQYWLGNLFQSKYGATSASSSFYSNWKTGSVSAIPSRLGPESSSASSSSTPAVSALESDTREFHMGKRNNYPSSGFSAFEGSHRWTVGNKASITLPLAEMGFPSRISFLNTGGFVTPSHIQILAVKVNGKEVGRYDYTIISNNHTIDIPLPKDDLLATIEFEIPTAISPSDLGIGADKRELGISFKEVQLQY